MNDHCEGCEGCKCKDRGLNQDLGNQQSLWEKTSEAPIFELLSGDVTVDTVVIGGGITGLTTAYFLQKAGQKVAVVEAAKVGMGVTGYTTAHLTEQLDILFTDLLKRFGETKARIVMDSTRAAMDAIEKNSQELGIEADFRRVPGYLYSESAEDVQFLQEEAEAGKRLGVNVAFTSDVPLPFKTVGAVKFERQAQFHPLKYIYGLAKHIRSQGGHIYEDARVTDVRGGKVVTSAGTVTGTHVVMATHTPILSRLLPIQGMLTPKRSYVLGVELKDNQCIPDGLYWDTNDPYHYTRGFTQGDKQTLVVGGEDHQAGLAMDTRKPFSHLEEYACEKFPLANIEHRWSAQYFVSADELPYIGRVPFMKNLYIATGFSGTGLTFGTVSALLITDLILGKSSAWAHVYKPGRISLKTLQSLTKFGLANMKHVIVDRFTSAAAGSPNDLAKGEGRVMRVEGKNMAVYKGEDGAVIKLSPVCTHAGCIVQWNSAGKSWDCPCHGSRFQGDGSVLVGPAVEDLRKL